MNMQELFVALVQNATDAQDRVYPQIAPDGVDHPFIVYQRVTENVENAMAGRTSLINTRLQVDVYANTYAQAQQIAAAVADLMAQWALPNVQILAQDIYESEVKLHRVMLDFSIWHT
jgi:hypothetical protein